MLVLNRPDACHRRLIAKSAAVGCSALGYDMILDGYAVVTLASSATTPQKLVSRDKRFSPSAFGLASAYASCPKFWGAHSKEKSRTYENSTPNVRRQIGEAGA